MGRWSAAGDGARRRAGSANRELCVFPLRSQLALDETVTAFDFSLAPLEVYEIVFVAKRLSLVGVGWGGG